MFIHRKAETKRVSGAREAFLALFLAASLSMTACGGSASAQTTAAQTTAAAETKAAETTPAQSTAAQTTAAAETKAAETTSAQTAAAAETKAAETTAAQTTAALTTAAAETEEALVAIDLVKPDEAYDFWNGDWFGWWEVTDPRGDWAQLGDLKMALMGEIEIAKNGRGVLMLWDDTAPRDDAMCEINVTVDNSQGSHGTAVSGEGYFLISDVLEGDWVIDPDKSGYDGMIRIDGTCTDEGNKAFDYHIYLKKWGSDWSTVEEKDQPPLLDWYDIYREKGVEMPHKFP